MDEAIDSMIFEHAFMDGNTAVISRFNSPDITVEGAIVTFSGSLRDRIVEELLPCAADEDEDGNPAGPGAITRFINREWGFDDDEEHLALIKSIGDSSFVMKNISLIVGDIVRDYPVDYALCVVGDNSMSLDLGLCEMWDRLGDSDWIELLMKAFNARDKKTFGWYLHYFQFRKPTIQDWNHVSVAATIDPFSAALFGKLRATSEAV